MASCAIQNRLVTTVNVVGQAVHMIVQIEKVRYNYIFTSVKDVDRVKAIITNVMDILGMIIPKSKEKVKQQEPLFPSKNERLPQLEYNLYSNQLTWYSHGKLFGSGTGHVIHVKHRPTLKADLKCFLACLQRTYTEIAKLLDTEDNHKQKET